MESSVVEKFLHSEVDLFQSFSLEKNFFLDPMFYF